MKIWRLGLTLIFGAGSALAVVFGFKGVSCAANAEMVYQLDRNKIHEFGNSPTDTHLVCPEGTPVCDYDSIQAAVDAASAGDIIKVATGTYSDISARPRDDITSTGMVSQVVYIDKSITIQGGYATDNWVTPNPDDNQTILDAQGRGRVIYITGEISPSITGLHITGGDSSGFGGWPNPWMSEERDAGGAIYAISATIDIQDNQIYSNTSTEPNIHLIHTNGNFDGNTVSDNSGGGVLLYMSATTLTGNTVTSNNGHGIVLMFDETVVSENLISSNSGSGLHLFMNNSWISGNTIISNTSSDSGAGVHIELHDPVLSDNFISGNTTNHSGGGMYLRESSAALINNTISANRAESGGGLYLEDSAVSVMSNTISLNIASGPGGGLYVGGEHPEEGNSAIIANQILTNSAANGGGLRLIDSSALVQGNTISANNREGVLVMGSSATFEDNIISANVNGGLLVAMFTGVVRRNLILHNTGAGLELFGWGEWNNNVIAFNDRGIILRAGEAHMSHNTIAYNDGGESIGIYATWHDDTGWYGNPVLTNTILVGHSLGINVTAGNTLTMNGILWHDTPVTVTHDLTAVVNLQNQVFGDPTFEIDGYHLLPTSAAIDKGVASGLSDDIDEQTRPLGLGYDLGADEYMPSADLSLTLIDAPDPAAVGHPLTFTVNIQNQGPDTVTDVLMTVTLPINAAFVSASGECTQTGITLLCDLGTKAPAGVMVVQATVIPSQVGQSIGHAQVGALGSDPNPSNNSQMAYTTVLAEPVYDPFITGLSPSTGFNDLETVIYLEGSNFQESAAVRLDEFALPAVQFIDSGHLRATVPTGLTAGVYNLTVDNPDSGSDTILNAFTVLEPTPPIVSSINPTQGPNDIANNLTIRGQNFADGVSVTLTTAGGQIPLIAPAIANSTEIRALTPISITPAVYDLVVTNPDGRSDTLLGAYRAVTPEECDDLYAGETDLWLDPPSLHASQAVTLGLTVRRQCGAGDLTGLPVRFWFEGLTDVVTGSAALLPPRQEMTVTAFWDLALAEGDITLYALIDPLEQVSENIETNNLISRTVTVLPPLPDTTPPVVQAFSINDGALYTPSPYIYLDTQASDNPGGSGVASLYFVEYWYDYSAGDWLQVASSDWLPYNQAQTDFQWRFYVPSWEIFRGARYMQVWAADAAGNISLYPGGQLINWHGYYGLIRTPWPIVLRHPLITGEGLRVRITKMGYITPSYRVPDLHLTIWDPHGEQLHHILLPYGEPPGWKEAAFYAVTDGVVQLEIDLTSMWPDWDDAIADYALEIIPLGSALERICRLVDLEQNYRTEPLVHPGYAPGRHIGIPGAPVYIHPIFLPLVLQN